MMKLLLKVRVLLPQIQVTLILDIKTQGYPTTDIGDADFLHIKTQGSPTTDIGDADFRY